MDAAKSILVVDDEVAMCDLVRDYLASAGFDVDVAHDGRQALRKFRKHDYEVVLTDLRMPDMDGMALLQTIKAERPETPVILITAFGTIDRAIEAMRAGAFHFVTKPFKMKELEVLVTRALEQRRLVEENRRLKQEVRGQAVPVIGHGKAMSEVMRLVRLVADTSSTVLILGESGTGKEVVARAIHTLSRRYAGPFVPVNCSAIPEGLLESELFGHARGAFTGAYVSRRGLFVEASGGTLFLDEIGDMGPGLQTRLLRVLQDRVVRPVGSNRSTPVDTRVLAATHQDLKALVKAGRFREDLYYRLSVIPIRIPSLSERIEDIPLLVDHFLKKCAARSGEPVKQITARAMDRLQKRAWEGNVRELENIVERLVVLTPGPVIDVDDIPEPAATDTRIQTAGGEFPTLAQLERQYVTQVLDAMGGNKEKAARILGINRRTLYRMQERWKTE